VSGHGDQLTEGDRSGPDRDRPLLEHASIPSPKERPHEAGTATNVSHMRQ
jgi:hypothetical protein